jgi:putative ABC transport system substrate-binding protein
VKRRDFLLGSLVVAAGAHGQVPAKLPRVGVLQNGTLATGGHLLDGFVRGLAERGYADGRNLVLEVRYAEGRLERLPALAQELASLNLDVLFAPSALAANAARKTGTATPIVFALAPDPVGEGFVASLARPARNMTGLTTQSPELGAKRVELLREVLPKMSRLAILYAEPFPGVSAELAEAERAAKTLGVEVVRVEAKAPDAFDAAFAEMGSRRADAMLVIENPMFFTNRTPLVTLAAKQRLPAIYRAKEYAVAGGLVSYGSDYVDLCRRAASYVDRILKGAKPGDLPVEQPVKFELVINVRAAKALGLTLSRELLLRADQVLD